jgi:hypothetical protein
MIAVLILSAALVLAGCGGHSAKTAKDKASASAAAAQIANSPSGKEAEAVVKGCENKNGPDPLSKANRNCIVPKGHGRAFLDCLVKHGLPKLSTKQERDSYAENQVVACAVSNR